MQKNKGLFKKISIEFLMGIIGIIGTSIESKIGLGLYLLILGLALLFGPKAEELKTLTVYSIGAALTVLGIVLFIWKIRQLKKEE